MYFLISLDLWKCDILLILLLLELYGRHVLVFILYTYNINPSSSSSLFVSAFGYIVSPNCTIIATTYDTFPIWTKDCMSYCRITF